MRNRIRRATIAMVVLTMLPAAAGAKIGTTRRMSTAPGAQPNGPTPPVSVPDVTSPALSLDGLTVAFSSDASNLVGGDTNGAADVFVRDLRRGTIMRVSVTRSGAQANGASYSPSLSVDGRWLAFASTATNLVSGDTNNAADIFLKDLKTGAISRVSVDTRGRQATGPSNRPFVSLFGQWITFESDAPNLVSGDDNDLPDAFLRDVKKKATYRVPIPGVATPAPIVPPEAGISEPRAAMSLWTSRASISYNGRLVAFLRSASRVSAPELGVNLPPLPPSNADVFVWDRSKRKVTAVKAPSWGGDTCAINDNPIISADGRKVVFESHVMVCRNGLVATNPVDFRDIMTYDTVSRFVGRASVNNWFQEGNGDSYAPSVSADASRIAFVSEADNLVLGDTNDQPDVFVRDERARVTSRISIGDAGEQANGASSRPSISYEGRNVVFASTAPNLAAGDTNGVSDVFWRDRRLDLVNAPPTIVRPFKGKRVINQLQETRLTLRGSDRDREPIRFGSVLPLPPTATLDTVTGAFSWTPTHSEQGNYLFAFWVEDPNGAKAYTFAEYQVRSFSKSVACIAGECSLEIPDLPTVPSEQELRCFLGLC